MSEAPSNTTVSKHGHLGNQVTSATDTPFIETLVAQKRPEDKSNDSSSGNQLQNHGVILQLRKICCTCIQAVSGNEHVTVLCDTGAASICSKIMIYNKLHQTQRQDLKRACRQWHCTCSWFAVHLSPTKALHPGHAITIHTGIYAGCMLRAKQYGGKTKDYVPVTAWQSTKHATGEADWIVMKQIMEHSHSSPAMETRSERSPSNGRNCSSLLGNTIFQLGTGTSR